MIFWMYCWIQFANTVLGIFAAMFIRILVCDLFLWHLVWFCCQGYTGLIKWILKCSFLFYIFIYFEYLGEFTSETIWFWTFICREVLTTDSIFLLVISLFWFSPSLWFSHGRLYIFRNLYISSMFSNLLVYDYNILLWLYFCSICYNISFHF